MTPIETTLLAPKPRATIELMSARADATPAPTLRSVRVSWFSHGGRPNGAGDRRFVLDVELQPSGDDTALVEAWVEQDGKRMAVLDQRPMRAAVSLLDGMRHIDIFGDNGHGRIAAISLIKSRGDHDHEVLVYAQTSLLGEAGFAAGTYAPPTSI